LLAFSRSQRIQVQPVIVCDVIEALRSLLERSLGPMIALQFRLNPDPVPVLSDPTQIEMMILNLAINARDAMPQGGTLTISTQIQELDKVLRREAAAGFGQPVSTRRHRSARCVV